jgi:hypothetical protein
VPPGFRRLSRGDGDHVIPSEDVHQKQRARSGLAQGERGRRHDP